MEPSSLESTEPSSSESLDTIPLASGNNLDLLESPTPESLDANPLSSSVNMESLDPTTPESLESTPESLEPTSPEASDPGLSDNIQNTGNTGLERGDSALENSSQDSTNIENENSKENDITLSAIDNTNPENPVENTQSSEISDGSNPESSEQNSPLSDSNDVTKPENTENPDAKDAENTEPKDVDSKISLSMGGRDYTWDPVTKRMDSSFDPWRDTTTSTADNIAWNQAMGKAEEQCELLSASKEASDLSDCVLAALKAYNSNRTLKD